jgi:hypothetical protein
MSDDENGGEGGGGGGGERLVLTESGRPKRSTPVRAWAHASLRNKGKATSARNAPSLSPSTNP